MLVQYNIIVQMIKQFLYITFFKIVENTGNREIIL